jgi:hypothetical protein
MKTIYLVVFTLFFLNKIEAQTKNQIIDEINKTFMSKKDDYKNKSIIKLFKNFKYPVKGYGLSYTYSETSRRAADHNVCYIRLYFTNKEIEYDLFNPQKKFNLGTVALGITIKNKEDYTIADNPFLSPRGKNNWNDSIESSVLKSGVIVGDLDLVVN